MMRKILKVIFIAVFFVGCATTTRVGTKVSLDMTTSQVIGVIGNPLKKTAYIADNGDRIEELYYRETTWDDGGWSWDRTIVTSVLVFKNDRLIAITDKPNQYKTRNPFDPTVNINQNITYRDITND